MAQGILSVSRGSKVITQLAADGTSGFLVNLGNVLDQSFAGSSPTDPPQIYIGGGNYSTLFDETATNITLAANEIDNTF